MSLGERYVAEHGDAFERLSSLPTNYGHCALVDYPWDNDYGREDDENPMFSREADSRVAEVLELLERVLVDGAYVIFFADDTFQDVVRRAMRETDGIIFRRNWVWVMGTFGMGYYGRVQHYPIPVATVGETERYVQDRGTIYYTKNQGKQSKRTTKPPGLCYGLLKPPVLVPDERLLEPFCGTAPGGDVAKTRGVRYWGCDTDREMVQLARQRTGGDSVDAE